MNLNDHLNLNAYLHATCQCKIGIGTGVTVDGLRGRGVVTARRGRRLTVQFRSGLKIERDQSFVHAI